MNLSEVTDPTMKLRLELAKLRLHVEEQDEELKKLRLAISALQATTAKLIRALGPK
jgi:hypothetical protein